MPRGSAMFAQCVLASALVFSAAATDGNMNGAYIVASGANQDFSTSGQATVADSPTRRQCGARECRRDRHSIK